MATFEIVEGLTYVSRTDWTPDPQFPRLGDPVPRSDRTHVILHHTVFGDSDNTPNVWESNDEIFRSMRKLQRIRPKLGLDVPYNFVAYFVAKGLVICEGRGEDRRGAHTKGHNTRGIAVSFAGNFEEDGVNDLEVMKRVPLVSAFLGWLKFSASGPDYGPFPPLKNLGSLKPDGRKVFFHKDFKPTLCPGKKIIAVADRFDFSPNIEVAA